MTTIFQRPSISACKHTEERTTTALEGWLYCPGCGRWRKEDAA